ncbi:MAG: DNA mismatch repair protein MutS [Endomicrobium sp.]|jgi:DNA mismatch repair protein MutS|nr:DNA mismatch repair protein MutS [Endomicrobium sp.]
MDNKKTNELTPLMKQYWDIKSKYLEVILLFRLGDFYEMFANDAILVSPILNIVLTQRCGIPMCGVPHNSLHSYLKKLIKAGFKVAICEQENKSRINTSQTKSGLIKRIVTKVITPGMILEDVLLDSKINNYLMSMMINKKSLCIVYAIADISTGRFFTYKTSYKYIENDICKYNPSEILIPDNYTTNNEIFELASKHKILISKINNSFFTLDRCIKVILKIFGYNSLKKFELNDNQVICVCGALLAYMQEMQSKSILIFSKIEYIKNKDFMYLDSNTIRHLEIVNSIYYNNRDNTSLLSMLDTTKTSSGARTLRQWILKPILNISQIKERQRCVNFFIQNNILREQIIKQLKEIYDIERIAARILSDTVTPRELIILKNSLKSICNISKLLQLYNTPKFNILLLNINKIINQISLYLHDEVSNNSLNDGNTINNGLNDELDKLKSRVLNIKHDIVKLEIKEQLRSGITTLKIKYTSILGYYIEISKSKLISNKIPKDYIRKQTTCNSERYITLELKKLEEQIYFIQEQVFRLENHLFRLLLKEIANFIKDILNISNIISKVDIFCCFAMNAIKYHYICPVVTRGKELSIKAGRHPVIERILKNGDFISNDIFFNNDLRVMILTGPNMAGKSTYVRQIALITIMAQIGSFVPAEKAKIGIIDRIFTRIGASDNITAGESTFMLEMLETSIILNQYTQRSLIILDEVGRGTSIYDGIAIALAIIEFLAFNKNNNIKVLFATHYLELKNFTKDIQGVKHYSINVQEDKEDIKFLYKIKEGCADHSYGIHVAKLAGMPMPIIERAYKILNSILKTSTINQTLTKSTMTFIINTLKNINLNNMKPLEALSVLSDLQSKVTNI